MTSKEINEAISTLSMLTAELESEFVESEGECTEATEQKESEINAIKELLTGEGVDYLGRWLKAKEDSIKAKKAEKDYIARQIEAENNTIEYIKAEISNILVACGEEKIKGSCGYSFMATTSVKTAVNKEVLNDLYMEAIMRRVEDIIPNDVTITLGASVKAVEGDVLPDYYTRTETPSCRFTKPRANKE